MSLSAEQSTAFLAHGGFTPGASSSLLVGVVFAVLLVWVYGRFAQRMSAGPSTS